MSTEGRARLVADLGGTNFRIGLAVPGEGLREVEVLRTAGVSDVAQTLLAYWQAHGAPSLEAVALCVAGPVDGVGAAAQARLTNIDLAVSAQALAAVFAVPAVHFVNDFAAVAAATPTLSANDLALHGEHVPPVDEPTVVLGPGTGLGVAAWLPGGVIVAGEGGHARLAAPDLAAEPAWDWLDAHFGFVTAEHVLSGRGLINLYRAVAAQHGLPSHVNHPPEVWHKSREGDAVALEALRHFTAALGAYAGDLALIFGAKGVLIAGGILPRWGESFDVTLFRAMFKAKEPGYQKRLAAIPSATVMHPYPALLGLSAC